MIAKCYNVSFHKWNWSLQYSSEFDSPLPASSRVRALLSARKLMSFLWVFLRWAFIQNNCWLLSFDRVASVLGHFRVFGRALPYPPYYLRRVGGVGCGWTGGLGTGRDDWPLWALRFWTCVVKPPLRSFGLFDWKNHGSW